MSLEEEIKRKGLFLSPKAVSIIKDFGIDSYDDLINLAFVVNPRDKLLYTVSDLDRSMILREMYEAISGRRMTGDSGPLISKYNDWYYKQFLYDCVKSGRKYKSSKSPNEIIRDFEHELRDNHDTKLFKGEDDTTFYIIDRKLVLSSRIIEDADSLGKPIKIAEIRELSPNIDKLKFKTKGIKQYKGLDSYYETINGVPLVRYYAEKYPELELFERYDQWEGFNNTLVVIEMQHKSGTCYYGCGYTNQKPLEFVRKIEKDLIRGDRPRTLFGEEDIFSAYTSWKGQQYILRFELPAKYASIDCAFKEKDDMIDYARSISESLKAGATELQFNTYIHPQNRWKSEETAYKLSQNVFGKENVKYQYRPSFLKSSVNGQMSYDIYLPKYKIAIEYQGQQHFMPVELWGGEDGFQALKKRDKDKYEISMENGIRIVYLYYWEDITETLISEKVKEIRGKKKSELFYEPETFIQ